MMKKNRTLRLLAFSLVTFLIFGQKCAFSQVIKGEMIAGFNLAQVDGDEVYGYKKPGLQLGLGAMIPIAKKWDISLETIYNEKGANQKAQYRSDSLNGAYKLLLNYVEVPVLVHFTDKEFITVGSGFSWGRLISAKEFEHGVQTPTTAQNNVYSPNDFNVLLDLRMRIYQRLKFNFRYQYSVTKIRNREFSTLNGTVWSRNQYNNLLTFRLVYVFNEERSERNRE